MNDSTQKLLDRIKDKPSMSAGTHYDGCEEEHILCACVKELEAQSKKIEELKSYIRKCQGVEQ